MVRGTHRVPRISRKARSAFRTTTEQVAGSAGNPRGAAARGNRRTKSEGRGSKDGSQSRLLSSRKSAISRMTKDGSRSRPSNHGPRTPSCGLPVRLRRAGCRQRRQPVPWRLRRHATPRPFSPPGFGFVAGRNWLVGRYSSEHRLPHGGKPYVAPRPASPYVGVCHRGLFVRRRGG